VVLLAQTDSKYEIFFELGEITICRLHTVLVSEGWAMKTLLRAPRNVTIQPSPGRHPPPPLSPSCCLAGLGSHRSGPRRSGPAPVSGHFWTPAAGRAGSPVQQGAGRDPVSVRWEGGIPCVPCGGTWHCFPPYFDSLGAKKNQKK